VLNQQASYPVSDMMASQSYPVSLKLKLFQDLGV